MKPVSPYNAERKFDVCLSNSRWYTKELKDLKNSVLAHHTAYMCTKAEVAKRKYSILKKEYKKKINEAKRSMYDNYINSSGNKCKSAWKIIKQETNMTNNTKNVQIDPYAFNEFCIKSIEDIADKFDGDIPQHYILTAPEGEFTWRSVTEDEVMKAAAELSSSHSSDIFGFSNFFIKKIVNLIVIPLTLLINMCIHEKSFPDCLKLSKVLPIFKRGDINAVSSYRPISLVPSFSKIIESLLYKQMNEWFVQHQLISPRQFGFQKNKSTVLALEYLVKEIITAFENKKCVSLTLCDLTKAFDCISHDLLIAKLQHYGIRGESLNLIRSYLKNRRQIVNISNKLSDVRHVTNGVPQGSILGPFLFLVLINYLPFSLPQDLIMYADDTTLITSHSDLNQLKLSQINNLNIAKQWFHSNKLVLNEEKTQKLILGLPNTLDNEISYVKLLGFYLDPKLGWHKHIESICTKLSRVIFVFRKLRPLVSTETLRQVYFALFESHINYGIHLWGSATGVNSILLLQKRALRVIFNKNTKESCRPLFPELKVMTVYNLFIYRTLIFLRSNIDFYQTRSDVHSFNTRNKDKLDYTRCRLSVSSNTCFFNGINIFNKLPLEARKLPINRFKSCIHRWLLNRPFYSVNEFMECDVNIVF